MWSVIGIAFCVLFFVWMLLVTDGVVGDFISEWIKYFLDKHRPNGK